MFGVNANILKANSAVSSSTCVERGEAGRCAGRVCRCTCIYVYLCVYVYVYQ